MKKGQKPTKTKSKIKKADKPAENAVVTAIPAWEYRRNWGGRPRIFETPEQLWQAATEYFDWCEKNPLKEQKVFAYKGGIIKTDVPHMRAMTVKGLCFYLGVNRKYLYDLKDSEKGRDFSEVIGDIEDFIYNQKFAGAAADMLNPVIIARDLGLKDASDILPVGVGIGNKVIIELIDSRDQVRSLEPPDENETIDTDFEEVRELKKNNEI